MTCGGPLILAAGIGSAQATSVSLELMLLVDSSGSIENVEWEFQRDAIAAAFRNPSVNTLFTSGNSVAVSLYFWAGDAGSGLGVQQEGVAWTQISSPAQAEAFADLVELTSRPDISTTARAQTAISRAIDQAVPLFTDNGFEGARNLIDISGDGFENVDTTQPLASTLAEVPVDLSSFGPFGTINVPVNPPYFWGIPEASSDAAIAADIGINGLVLLDGLDDATALVTDVNFAPSYYQSLIDAGLSDPEATAAQAQIEAEVGAYLAANYGGQTMLELFYGNYIIGAPDGDPEAQLFIAEDNAAFADAIAMKLASEVIPEPAAPVLVMLGGLLGLARRRRDSA